MRKSADIEIVLRDFVVTSTTHEKQDSVFLPDDIHITQSISR